MKTPVWWNRTRLLEDLNFLLTNRVPRIALTRFMGWFSAIESPWLCWASIAVWRLFTDLDLSESRQTRFTSLQQCFTRELKPGLRPIDPDPAVLVSPSDAIVGECGDVREMSVFQAKGFPYRIEDLFGSAAAARPFANGSFVTLRLTSAMYHRFHAPAAGSVEHVTYISGDTWNVNPIALERVAGLFCRNERAAIRFRLAGGPTIAIVPVAAILVASIRLHGLDTLLHLRYRGPNEIACNRHFERGEEMGWFQHGSTILVFVPPGYRLGDAVCKGRRIRMGEPLLARVPCL